ncbi:MAG: type II secretion system minor pseudopilin GspH [Gammaproteobacteria bacterium]|nr:type II secretion system minor pseudopilin GspH [Gammaproteobacteria bacterium]
MALRWRSGAAGFTLIEMLVVTVIIALLMGLVVLSLPARDPDRPLRDEAERMAALVKMLQQEAVFQSREMAIEFGAREYRFLTLEQQGWIGMTDAVYRDRSLPQDITLHLIIEGEEVSLQPTTEDQQRPRVFLFSSGEMTPFDVIFEHRDRGTRYRYSILGAGRAQVEKMP